MKNVKKKIEIVIITLILCVISSIITYYATLAIDKSRKGGDVNIVVTLDDNEISSYLQNDKDYQIRYEVTYDKYRQVTLKTKIELQRRIKLK